MTDHSHTDADIVKVVQSNAFHFQKVVDAKNAEIAELKQQRSRIAKIARQAKEWKELVLEQQTVLDTHNRALSLLLARHNELVQKLAAAEAEQKNFLAKLTVENIVNSFHRRLTSYAASLGSGLPAPDQPTRRMWEIFAAGVLQDVTGCEPTE